MRVPRFSFLVAIVVAAFPGWRCAGQGTAENWGAPPVNVSHAAGKWTIAGRKNTAVLNEKDLSLTVQAGPATWKMVPSSDRDMRVRAFNDEFSVRLADARDIQIAEYRTGFKTGVKITLDGFQAAGVRAPGAPIGLRLYLTVAMEGGDEDLDFEVSAVERGASIRELNWPTAMDGREVGYTVLSNDEGELLPRNWPTRYDPIHRAANDTSIIQSNLIECWSMSWWGFQKGASAMMVIVETPDDAAYTFSHPPGGPTSIGPTWRPQLGRWGYLRSLRMAFLPKGNYVQLAKRYRKYVIDSGHFLSLKEKIARNPAVAELIGVPSTGASVLRNFREDSRMRNPKNPQNNYRLTTYAQQIEHLRALKAQGWEKLNVTVSGWPNQGYDRQHPDVLPPNREAGGWDGMKALFDACKELGFTCGLHDQYRDYYTDAPSYSPEFSVHEEDSTSPPTHFPGTRFHPDDWKAGYIPFMNHWDGGTQTYLDNRYMLGHIEKNYRLLWEHGIRPRFSNLDVFGYIPPDEDFNPEHPCSHTESMKYRAEVFNWVRANVGYVETEAGADWTIPYVDMSNGRYLRNSNSGNDQTSQDAIPVPLYDLVYHDAIVTTGIADLRSWLLAGVPGLGGGGAQVNAADVKRHAALQKRVALLEMTNHEFLDEKRTRERTTFADGTMVTVDWQTRTVEIKPELETR